MMINNNINNMNNNMNMINNINNMNMMINDMLFNINQNMNNIENDEIEEAKKIKEKRKKERIDNYYYSKDYEFDIKIINAQNKCYEKIKKKLSKFKEMIDKNIKYNNNIINYYLNEPFKKENLLLLIKLSSSLLDKYNNNLKEYELITNEIKELFKLNINELKNKNNNFLINFNKRYNTNLKEDMGCIVYHNIKELHEMDEIQFVELCRIDFKNLKTLELSINDNYNIEILTTSSFYNLIDLMLYGKIIDIKSLQNLPFKNLNCLFLTRNNLNNIDNIFEKVQFHNLNKLILQYNSICNIKGLSKAPFKNLQFLDLSHNEINDINCLSNFPFNNLEDLRLSCNNIESIDILSNVSFRNLTSLDLSANKIVNINVFSNVNFKNLQNLLLDENQIKNIDILNKVPFINLKDLKLGYNPIQNINVLFNLPFNEITISLDLNLVSIVALNNENNKIKFVK